MKNEELNQLWAEIKPCLDKSPLDAFHKAIIFATIAHSGDNRKGTEEGQGGIPYIVHPLEAAAIAATMTRARDVLAAAALHDVVEDAGCTLEDIKEAFSEKIEKLVAAESENKREGQAPEDTWKIRKEETLEQLERKGKEAKTIALSDKLANIRAIHRDFLDKGNRMWEKFNQKDKSEHAWYYASIAKIVSSELGEKHAYQEYQELIRKVFGDVPASAPTAPGDKAPD